MMMNEQDIRTAIIRRLQEVDGTCNRALIDDTDAILRGLVMALTCSDPGPELTKDVPHLLTLAGIPYEVKEDPKRGRVVEFKWDLMP